MAKGERDAERARLMEEKQRLKEEEKAERARQREIEKAERDKAKAEEAAKKRAEARPSANKPHLMTPILS